MFDKAFDCLLLDMATIKRVYLENLVQSGILRRYELLKQRQKPPELKFTWASTTGKSKMELETTLDVFSLVSLTLISDKDKPLSIKAELNSP